MKNLKKKKTEMNKDKNKKFDNVCYHYRRKEHMSQDCRERKHGNNKMCEKTEKAVDRDEVDLVLCLLTMENKKENVKRKFGSWKMLNNPLRLV